MKTYHFQLPGVRGVPGILAVLLLGIVAVGVVSFLIFAGLAIATVGLGLTAGAALYYSVKRKLGLSTQRPGLRPSTATRPPMRRTEAGVIEIEATRVESPPR